MLITIILIFGFQEIKVGPLPWWKTNAHLYVNKIMFPPPGYYHPNMDFSRKLAIRNGDTSLLIFPRNVRTLQQPLFFRKEN